MIEEINYTQVFGLMILFGFFTFFSCGLSVAFSIEAKESETVSKILTALTAVGFFAFIIGIIGLLFLA